MFEVNIIFSRKMFVFRWLNKKNIFVEEKKKAKPTQEMLLRFCFNLHYLPHFWKWDNYAGKYFSFKT